MGEAESRIALVSSVADAESVEVEDPERVAYITQTTLSMEDTRPIVDTLKRRFPHIAGPAKDDICYATQNRQLAVRALAREAPVILVIGSKNSSNSNRLVEEAELAGARAYLVDDASGVDPAWLAGASTVGVTSGASAPEFLVDQMVAHLTSLGAERVERLVTVEEDVHFALPAELLEAKARAPRAAVALPTV
jgi:4-hydroxy-3-methylbut-2-enyl diphosphate reductase